jgi:glycyl-tRNA synthetase beta chain
MTNLLVELFVEELPPKALKKLGEAFANQLAQALAAQGLLDDGASATPFASPRRLAAHVSAVRSQAPDRALSQKLMPVGVGLDASGAPTPALAKKLQALGVPPEQLAQVTAGLRHAPDGKATALFFDSVASGATLAMGLQKALDEALAKLPIPKVMSYQLQTDCELPGWSSVNFVRPAHALVALHGADVVAVRALGLTAGRHTHGHRFEASQVPVMLDHADHYAATLARDGAVIASFAERRAEIARQLAAAATQVGGGCTPIEDEALLDEVTALVERPNVLACQFEPQFLEVPQECLILTMKANQKYFPLLDAAGKLTNQFLVVSNISPDDASAVVQGNERVVRPRLADAQFFFNQDRKKTLASRVAGLDKVVYHNKLGTQGQRVARARAIARVIAQTLAQQGWGGADLVAHADLAAQLAKTDLLTDMVGEFPELQGIMGGYYARHDGLDERVAQAIEDHYKPRFAGDELPRNPVGLVVALADKLETLAGLFGIGQLPSGDKDPFALRRHALGVIRMLVERGLALNLPDLVDVAFAAFGPGHGDAAAAVKHFVFERLTGYLRELGYSVQEVEAVIAVRPGGWGQLPARLAAVHAFAALPQAAALAAANKRIGNILKKAEAVEVDAPAVQPERFAEPAEHALWAAMQATVPMAARQFQAGEYAASLQTLAALREPVDAFFDKVMVNADDPAVRANRLALLRELHLAMNQVADLSRLAV